jgi:hypothetical protein
VKSKEEKEEDVDENKNGKHFEVLCYEMFSFACYFISKCFYRNGDLYNFPRIFCLLSGFICFGICCDCDEILK